MLDELDKKIIAAIQEDFPLVSEPYRELADRINISEEELLARLDKFRRSGEIRRMGAVLRHREVGYAANALCAWKVPESRLEEVAAVMTSRPEITHCYARVAHPDWRYNFYTMLHGHTKEECRAVAAELAEKTGVPDYIMLFSTREWKKSSMHYFGG